MPDWSEITTPTQLFYHLDRGEVVAFLIEDGEAFLQRVPEGWYRIILQPRLSSGLEFRQDKKEAVQALFEELRGKGISFWVFPGSELKRVDASWWKRAVGRVLCRAWGLVEVKKKERKERRE
ncbi:hypothetical protein [Neomoorella thermoacetica]|uniref:hypothetical protein n=1 Tax=Neomoorella thermoacetica TaxID=1525 RepID=UPI0030CF88B5